MGMSHNNNNEETNNIVSEKKEATTEVALTTPPSLLHIAIPLDESYNVDLKPFPTPFDGDCDYGDGIDPYTIKEMNIMKIMGAIKDKPNWINKIQDSTILSKWKKELVEGSNNNSIEHPSQLEYAIDE